MPATFTPLTNRFNYSVSLIHTEGNAFPLKVLSPVDKGLRGGVGGVFLTIDAFSAHLSGAPAAKPSAAVALQQLEIRTNVPFDIFLQNVL